MKTYTLRNGIEVLAKDDGYPYGYANLTQAQARAQKTREEFGDQVLKVWVTLGRPFYVGIIRNL